MISDLDVNITKGSIIFVDSTSSYYKVTKASVPTDTVDSLLLTNDVELFNTDILYLGSHDTLQDLINNTSNVLAGSYASIFNSNDPKAKHYVAYYNDSKGYWFLVMSTDEINSLLPQKVTQVQYDALKASGDLNPAVLYGIV